MSIDRLKAAHLCFEALNQPQSDFNMATEQNSTSPLAEEHEMTQEFNEPIRQTHQTFTGTPVSQYSRHGRILKYPAYLHDYA